MRLGSPLRPALPHPLPTASEVDENALAAVSRRARLCRYASYLSWEIYLKGAAQGLANRATSFDDANLNLLARAHTFRDTVIIEFRGTVGPILISTNWRKINFRKKLIGAPPRHQGFDEAWMILRPKIIAWLQRTEPTTIVFTGHSLGAALAQLAAYDLAAMFRIERVILFAPPMVGGRAFNEAYAQTLVHGTDKLLGPITEKYLLLTDAIALPVPGFEPGEPIWRIGRFGRHVGSDAMPSFFGQVSNGVTGNGPDPRQNEISRFPTTPKGIDWGPPTIVDQVLPNFRGAAAAGGMWGWAAYVAVAATSPVLRALGFHSMAGYAKALGNHDIHEMLLPEEL